MNYPSYLDFTIFPVVSFLFWDTTLHLVDRLGIAVDGMCAPQIHRLKYNSQCDGIWGWGFWEVIRA